MYALGSLMCIVNHTLVGGSGWPIAGIANSDSVIAMAIYRTLKFFFVFLVNRVQL